MANNITDCAGNRSYGRRNKQTMIKTRNPDFVAETSRDFISF